MDELALQNVPQGTVSVTELQTALARAEAERVLFFEKYGPRGGGDFPLFGGSADERATHEAEVAALLAETSGVRRLYARGYGVGGGGARDQFHRCRGGVRGPFHAGLAVRLTIGT